MAYKVLMIAPRPFFIDYGFAVQILEEYKALQERGNEIILTCYHLGRQIEGIKISRSLNVPWYKDPMKNVSFHYLYLDFLLLIHTFNVARRFKPDIIHAHIHEGGLIGNIVGKLLGIPVILDIQGSMLGEYKERGLPSNKFIDGIIGFIENSINRNSDGLFVEMEMRKDLLLKVKGIDQSRIHHFKLGIDTDHFSIKNNDDRLISSLNIPSDRKIIGYVGLLTSYQGIDHMLEAMQLILQKRKDVHLLVMGYLNIEMYKQKATDLGLDGHVTFTGKMPYHDTPKYLGLCEVAVGPKVSLQETNGKLIPYMSMGLPTVAFDTHMNREYLGELGIYAKYKDTQDLADCIMKVLNSPDDYKEVKIKLRERAIAEFGLRGMADNMMNMYDSVIRKFKSR